VNVTALDYKTLMAEFIREYLRITLDPALSQPQLGVAGINTLFLQYANDEALGTVDNEIVIKVVQADKSWKIEPDNNLINALFGGAIRVAGDFFSP